MAKNIWPFSALHTSISNSICFKFIIYNKGQPRAKKKKYFLEINTFPTVSDQTVYNFAFFQRSCKFDINMVAMVTAHSTNVLLIYWEKQKENNRQVIDTYFFLNQKLYKVYRNKG